MKRRIWAALLAAAVCLSLAACSDSDNVTADVTDITESSDSTDSDTQEASADTQSDEPAAAETSVSFLTGEALSSEYAGLRPIAVMIPNDNYGALPHVGIGEAGIVYEILVEGSYTRLMALFDAEAYSQLDQIGPVRSCREYFCYYALEYDAIYVHYGQSSTAVSFLDSGAIDHINGMTDSAFYRDSTSHSSPNNAFTSASLLAEEIASKGFETTYSSDYTGTFVFSDTETTPEGGVEAYVVNPEYPIDDPWFEYNEEDGLYYRFEYGEAHTDSLTGEQLSYKNIIIMSVPTVNTNDEKNHIELTVTGTGEGYYVTNGTAIEITWSKDSETSVTHYYDTDGNEIELNTGKTFVCVESTSYFADVTFEGK